LQRRIVDDGASFRELLLEARKELAREYLIRPEIDIEEVAYFAWLRGCELLLSAFGRGRGRHPPIGSQHADGPTKRKRLIEDIVGINLPVQNEIDQFEAGKEFAVYITKMWTEQDSNWQIESSRP